MSTNRADYQRDWRARNRERMAAYNATRRADRAARFDATFNIARYDDLRSGGPFRCDGTCGDRKCTREFVDRKALAGHRGRSAENQRHAPYTVSGGRPPVRPPGKRKDFHIKEFIRTLEYGERFTAQEVRNWMFERHRYLVEPTIAYSVWISRAAARLGVVVVGRTPNVFEKSCVCLTAHPEAAKTVHAVDACPCPHHDGAEV